VLATAAAAEGLPDSSSRTEPRHFFQAEQIPECEGDSSPDSLQITEGKSSACDLDWVSAIRARPRPTLFKMGTRARIEELVTQATSKYPDTGVRLDALEKAGPPVLIALMTLAEDMDVLRQRVDAMGTSQESAGSVELTRQLSRLTSQINKMTRTVQKLNWKRKKK